MREFSTTVNRALANGLLPNEAFRDTQFFKDLYNLVPHREALRPYEAVVDILQLDHQAKMYPFPQWFRFEDDNILLANNDISSLNDEFTPFDVEFEAVKHWQIGDFTEPFRGVDYGSNWILLNRDGAIYKMDGEITSTEKLRASALVEHKNRTLIGGSPNGMWTDAWKDALDDIMEKYNIDKELWSTDLGSNFVLWSSFDSVDFPFALIDPKKVFAENANMFTERLYGNEFGFIEVPITGAILDMISSLDQVFVFGEDGICALAMVPDSPGAGFVKTGEQPIGLKSRGAVGGDDSSFVFIDNEDNLWHVSSQGMQKLDYRKYMSELTGQIYIHKDPDDELFYIGDDNASFVLNDLKLSRVFQTVISMDGGYDFLAGVVYETGPKGAIVHTEAIDIGVPGLKTLTGIHLSTDEPFNGKARATAEVRGKRVQGEFVILNHEGYAATRLFGKNHEIQILFENYENVQLDGIELKWQTDDARQRRGFFATQDSTGAG